MRKYYQETSTEVGRLAKSQGLTSHVVALEIEVKEVYLNFGGRNGINGWLMNDEKKEIKMTLGILA